MAELTAKGYENITKSILNKDGLNTIAKKLAEYYMSVLKNINTFSIEHINNVYEKINSVFKKLNFNIIPTNIIEFNLNQYLSKNETLSHSEKADLIAQTKSIINMLKSSNSTKIFNKDVVNGLGFAYESVYKKERYFINPAEKYNDFLTTLQNVICNNIFPETFSSPWEYDVDKNSSIINLTTNTPTYQIKKYYQNLKFSGGYCNQENKDKIDIIINACGTTSIASIIHEVLHAMSYNEYEDSYESGFNTVRTRAISGYRKYQIFNEITNEYLTQKVLNFFSNDDCKSFEINKHNINIYKDMIFLIKKFLDKYETEIVSCLLSSNPMQFRQIIEEKNFDSIAESLDKIQFLLDFRFYDNTSVFQFMEKKLQQNNIPILIAEKLSIKAIFENLEEIRCIFHGDNYVMPIIEEMSKLQSICEKVMHQKPSLIADFQNIKI